MRGCPGCGVLIPEAAAFCPSCGRRQGEEGPAAAVPPPLPLPPPPLPDPGLEETRAKVRSIGRVFLILGILKVLAAPLLAVVVAFAALGGGEARAGRSEEGAVLGMLFFAVIAAYSLVLGVLQIVSGNRLLSLRGLGLARGVAIATMIGGVAGGCGCLDLVAGIYAAVQLNDPKVAATVA